jgi:hypothetical protein
MQSEVNMFYAKSKSGRRKSICWRNNEKAREKQIILIDYKVDINKIWIFPRLSS